MTAWGVIFDWDGVVVDSAAPHEASWRQLAAESGYPFPDDFFKRGFGMKNETIIRTLFEWTQDGAEIRRLSDRKEVLYRQLIETHGIVLLPGAGDMLAGLRALRIPCAVGSSTPRANLTCVMERLGLADTFAALVASEDVSHGKPDPEVFLLAAARLGVAPARCVVVEDAPVGIEAARAAGMQALAVTTTHPRQALREAHRIVDRLSEVSVTELESFARNGRTHGPG